MLNKIYVKNKERKKEEESLDLEKYQKCSGDRKKSEELATSKGQKGPQDSVDEQEKR